MYRRLPSLVKADARILRYGCGSRLSSLRIGVSGVFIWLRRVGPRGRPPYDIGVVSIGNWPLSAAARASSTNGMDGKPGERGHQSELCSTGARADPMRGNGETGRPLLPSSGFRSQQEHVQKGSVAYAEGRRREHAGLEFQPGMFAW